MSNTSTTATLLKSPVQLPIRYLLTILRREAANAGDLVPANPLRDPREEDEFIDLLIPAHDDETAGLKGSQYALSHNLSYWEVRAVRVTIIAAGPHFEDEE